MDTREQTVTGGRLVTRELAEWVAGLRYEDIPADAVEEAGRALSDFFCETLYVGACQPWGRSIAEFAAIEGGPGDATIIASGGRTSASKAAFANGTMALGFELADFGAGSRYYPFTVTGPLAVAESRHRSGRDFVTAVVLGYELMARILKATKNVVPGQRGTGPAPAPGAFYVPAVYGTVASAAGSARVLGLDPQHTNYAIGLGTAFAGGTFQGHEEGAWQRSLNGGMASERGVTAALLGQQGFKATEMGLEGVQGFAVQYSGGHLDPDALFDGLGDSWVITERWSKSYPLNVTLHAPVEALNQIMQENNLTHTDIAEIDAAWQRVEEFLAKSEVTTVVGAQASLYYALAVTAVRGHKPTVDDVSEENVADPVVQAMIDRISVHADEELFSQVRNSMPGAVTVRTTDGREFHAEVRYPRGNAANRLPEDEFFGKYLHMTERVIGRDQATELYERARNVQDIEDIAELGPLMSPKATEGAK
ncbi:MAG TPA: MmgE/PrpD family protein [Acidimicrobiales bacterium]